VRSYEGAIANSKAKRINNKNKFNPATAVTKDEEIPNAKELKVSSDIGKGRP
jgi:hypothetical protein